MSRRLLFACALAVAPSTAQAQWPAHATVYERQTRERWMNGHQSPAFTRWVVVNYDVKFDSTVATPNGTQLFLTTQPQLSSGAHVSITLDPRGQITGATDSFFPPVTRSQYDTDSNSVERRRAEFDGVLAMPQMLAWDLIPPLPAGLLRTGERWVDTVNLARAHAGMRQSLRGVRITRVVGDTVIDGKHFWRMRDTLRATYAERFASWERTVAAEVYIDRDTRGVSTGIYLVDPATRTVRSRDDSSLFRGTAVLRYPDGKSYSTPTTFERSQHIAGFDSAAYVAVIADRRANRPRGSMFIFPTGKVQERLAAGDVKVRDSVLRIYEASRDVDQRLAIRRDLDEWQGSPQTALGDTLLAIDLRNGDLASALHAREFAGSDKLTSKYLHLLLPLIRDPKLAFAWGLSGEELYDRMPMKWAPGITPDSATWPCTPAACRELSHLRIGERDPLLRRAGAFATFIMDPRRWADSVGTDSSFAQFRDLVRGVGATWAGSSHPPMPPATADWHAWIEWMNGGADTGAAARPVGTPPPVRFGDTHRVAVLFFELLSGRNLTREWQNNSDRASSEAERYVYETMLYNRGAWHPDPDSVMTWLFSSTKLTRARGDRGVDLMIPANSPPPDSATATLLIDRILAHVMDNEAPWLSFDTTAKARPVGTLLDNATRPGRGLAAQPAQTIYVKVPFVTEALRAKWGSRVTFITDSTWKLTRNLYPAADVTITVHVGHGRYASVGADIFSASEDAKGINAGEGGNTYTLVLTPEGWKIVSISGWVV